MNMASPASVRFLDRSTAPHILTLILLAAVSALGLNIFLPSLPAMTEYFDTEYRLVQLSVGLYLAMNAVMHLVLGPLSDRFGRRPVMLWSVSLFCLATLGCIFAPTIEAFLVFRMLQAFIVSGIVLGRAIVRDMNDQDRAASMIGYVTMGMAVAPMIGPAIGGLLGEAFGWQSTFWLLFTLGLAVLALAWNDLGETARSTSSSFASQIRQYPELFASRRFWGYCFAAALASGAFFAYLGGAPFVGAEVFGLSPAELGLFFGAPAIGYMIGNGISGRYSTRYGINQMILWGAVTTAVGLGMSLAIDSLGHTSKWTFFGFMTFVGLGNGLVIPNSTAGMLSVRPHLAGSASGLGGAIMIGGGAALSTFSGVALAAGNGAAPLIWLMFLSTFGAVICAIYIILRERRVGEG